MPRRISPKRRSRDKDVNRWLRIAKQRLTTADFLAQHRMYLDSMYLAGYCPECVLKALLLRQLPSHRRKAYISEKFRSARAHDYEHLKELLFKDFAVKIPLEIAQRMRRMAWSTELRYEVGRGEAAEAESFLEACHQVLQWGERSI